MTDHLGDELRLLRAVTRTQRVLLGLEDRVAVRAALVAFVEELGGEVVPAHPPRPDALPIDLSLGAAEPVVPVAALGTPLRAQLERVLPELVSRAHRLTSTLDSLSAARGDVPLDHLTGAPRRAHLLTALERAVPGEDRLLGVVVGAGGWLIEPFGRMRVDGLVRSLADIVRSLRQPTDPWARLDGHGVAVLAIRSDEGRTAALADEVRRRWADEPGFEIGLRVASVAVVDPPVATLDRLEAALGQEPAERSAVRTSQEVRP